MCRFNMTIASFLLAGMACANDGFEHIQGIALALGNQEMTVLLANGNTVKVKLDTKTEYIKDDKVAALTDLRPGMRVQVDIPEGSNDKIAHLVKIPTAHYYDQHGHEFKK